MTDRLKAFRTLRRIDAETVRLMRQDVFEDHLVSEAEVRSLVALGRDVPSGDAEWTQFYCEAITDWAMRQDVPEDYVSEEAAARLAAMLGDGAEISPLEIDLLAHLFHHARSVPDALTSRAMLAVRAGVLADGKVTEREVRALRRFFYAPGGEGRIGITRAEAEIVFDINDAARGADNAPDWTVLFRQAITAYVMSHAGYAAPDRDEALRLRRFMDAPGGMTFGSKDGVRGALRAVWHGLTGKDAAEALRRDMRAEREAMAAHGAVLTDDEVAWLVRRIQGDGAVCEAERLLVRSLRDLMAERGARMPSALAALAS